MKEFESSIKVRLTEAQKSGMEQMSAREGASVSVLVRQRIDEMLIPSDLGEWV